MILILVLLFLFLLCFYVNLIRGILILFFVGWGMLGCLIIFVLKFVLSVFLNMMVCLFILILIGIWECGRRNENRWIIGDGLVWLLVKLDKLGGVVRVSFVVFFSKRDMFLFDLCFVVSFNIILCGLVVFEWFLYWLLLLMIFMLIFV